jgi:hypothetical protein
MGKTRNSYEMFERKKIKYQALNGRLRLKCKVLFRKHMRLRAEHIRLMLVSSGRLLQHGNETSGSVKD